MKKFHDINFLGMLFGSYRNWLLNATKEAIRLGEGGGGLKKLIVRNNDKSSKIHYRLLLMVSTQLDMSHIQSYINSMLKIIILIRRSI